MALRGSISRSIAATVRASSFRTPTTRILRSCLGLPVTASRHPRRRLSSIPARLSGELGCVQLLLPLQALDAAPRLTSSLSLSMRACCQFSRGNPLSKHMNWKMSFFVFASIYANKPHQVEKMGDSMDANGTLDAGEGDLVSSHC
ncbi:hypothetical protein ZIOFF_024767 [Zingiber officinale]|uniref:Uncharacterized protein n=1 Tax=Zingiber officinale TaxID=94328 RepID=A0A8J5LGF7_ZINOF|nr:hypothetical protein ZIOFF_024767 [Zingiber officinale]